MEDKNKFELTYKAPSEKERKTIESIKGQYEVNSAVPKSAYARIVKLDKKIKNTATTIALAFGIVGALIFGTGLTMVLEWGLIYWGILVATLGVPFIALAKPMHSILIKCGKKKHGATIIKLSEEFLEEGKK